MNTLPALALILLYLHSIADIGLVRMAENSKFHISQANIGYGMIIPFVWFWDHTIYGKHGN